MLKFNVRNQSINRIDNFRPAEKSIKYLLAQFDFKTEDWKETFKTAVFRNTKTGKPYDAILDEDTCVVPWEVLSESGACEVSVYGIKSDGSRITTDKDVFNLNSTIYGGSATQEPTPTVYETLVLGIDKLENKVGEIEDKIENLEPSQPGGTGGNITVDSALSAESENPVQNKVVAQKFGELDKDIEELSRKVEEENVTSEKITTALGYTPANQEDVDKLSQEIGDIGQIKTVTGTSVTVTDAIDGKVISCVGDSAVTVSGYNICSVKELSGVGYAEALFGTTVPAGTYTITANVTTNNPDVRHIVVRIGPFQIFINCGERQSETINITREVDAILSIYASDKTSPYTEYSATISDIVITADSTVREYEPYFESITYDADNLDNIKLTEYTNIITSDSEFTLKYVHRNAYVKSLLSSIDVETKTYVTPEDFGAYGNGMADDTQAVNECVAYAIENSMPIRGYGKYRTTAPINIIGNYVDLHIYQIDYLGDDNAVVYQGSNSFITIQSIQSKGNGLYIKAETETVYYNTFTVNNIISEKNGVHIFSKENNYQNKLYFNLIRAKGEYSCILFERDENADTGYFNEWVIRGGLVTGGLWGIRGWLQISDSIHVHAEALGYEGSGGAIYSNSGSIPRIYYCRAGEVVQINSFLKVSGVFKKPQIAEICKIVVPLESIDITELELDDDIELQSGNIQMITGLEVQKEVFSGRLLTKNLIIWGNRFQFPPVNYIRLNVDTDIDMTPQYYNEEIPQCFVAKADATINLHPTYAANCLSTFEIVQEEGHKLMVKDFVGNVIFDGTQYEDGRYRLTAYITDDSAIQYDMRNQLWDIVKLC